MLPQGLSQRWNFAEKDCTVKKKKNSLQRTPKVLFIAFDSYTCLYGSVFLFSRCVSNGLQEGKWHTCPTVSNLDSPWSTRIKTKCPSLEPLKRSTAGHSRSISESWRPDWKYLQQWQFLATAVGFLESASWEFQKQSKATASHSFTQLHCWSLLHGVKIFVHGLTL